MSVTPESCFHLTVEVVSGRHFAIAATSPLALPVDFGRLRIVVRETSAGARGFVRLYGALREPDVQRTLGLAQDETPAGERVFEIDPRTRPRPEAPLQLQLGVEGEPGACTVFEQAVHANQDRHPSPAWPAEP